MTFKRTLFYAQKALIIILVVMIMVGVTGLSFKAHYCHNHLSGIAFYPELGIQKSVTCGCKEDENNGKTIPATDLPISLNKNSCCENVSFYSKLHIESQIVNLVSLVPTQFANYVLVADLNIIAATEENAVFLSDDEFRQPPPISGRKLVLFLSQQRIPLIS